jgi:two-component system response regulator (stage 0 sporulation protein F)
VSPNRTDSSRSSIQVLVADEDAALRLTIAAALSDDGYEVVECADGAALFRGLERRLARPGARKSVVIAQARLPGLGAFRILHSLRALDIKIPVVLMTRLREPSLPDLAEKAGVSAFLTKPIQLPELRRLVAALLEPVGTAAVELAAGDLGSLR